jgi:hypothetical protein
MGSRDDEYWLVSELQVCFDIAMHSNQVSRAQELSLAGLRMLLRAVFFDTPCGPQH